MLHIKNYDGPLMGSCTYLDFSAVILVEAQLLHFKTIGFIWRSAILYQYTVYNQDQSILIEQSPIL